MNKEWRYNETAERHELYADGQLVAFFGQDGGGYHYPGDIILSGCENDKGLSLKGVYDCWMAPGSSLSTKETEKLKSLVENLLTSDDSKERGTDISPERVRFSLEVCLSDLDCEGVEITDEDVKRAIAIAKAGEKSMREITYEVLSDIRNLDEEREEK